MNLAVRLSYDEGRGWAAGKTIYPYASAYCDTAVLPLHLAARCRCAASFSGGDKCCVCHCLRWTAQDVDRIEKHCLPVAVASSTVRKQCRANGPFSGKQWHTAACQKNLPDTDAGAD